MKLVTFIDQKNEERIGAIDNLGRIADLHRAYGAYLRQIESNLVGDRLAEIALGRDMVEFLKRGEKAFDAARKALAHAEKATEDTSIVLDPRRSVSNLLCRAPARLYLPGKIFPITSPRWRRRRAPPHRWHFSSYREL